MWLFEKRGFVSVVAYDPSKDRNTKSEFRNIAKKAGTHLLIRARIKEDLDMIKEVLPTLVIETDAGADYAYRAVVPRKHFKKWLARAVDGIDYDSHFKEVARDNSKGSKDRYTAMMSVWSAMSRLQPIAPWSGSSWSSGYSWSGKNGKSGTADGSVVGSKTSTTTPIFKGPGSPDMQAFLEDYIESGGTLSYRDGSGPRTGYKKDDRVIGYFGAGTVTEVVPDKKGVGADTVRVRDDKTKVVKNFMSNYLIPEGLPDPDEAVILDADLVMDLDETYEWIKTHDVQVVEGNIPEAVLKATDADAFELLTRVQERVQERDMSGVTLGMLNEAYDEVLWEISTDEQRREIFSEGIVPPKYEEDAVKLFAGATAVNGADYDPYKTQEAEADAILAEAEAADEAAEKEGAMEKII